MGNVDFEICALGVLEIDKSIKWCDDNGYFADDGESVKCLYVEFEFWLPKNYRILYLGFSFIAFYS